MARFSSSRVCLVTGGASGLGRAIGIALAKDGHKVAIGDIADPKAVIDEITAAGGTAFGQHLDVTDSESIRTFVANTLDNYGQLDCAFNNAGIEGSPHRLDEYPEDEWRHLLEVNLIGVFNCMRYELGVMSDAGAIVNVGSTASLRARPRTSAYAAAKHGLVGLTKSAALDYAKRGIRINLLCPGGFRTPMSERINKGNMDAVGAKLPMQRVADVQEIADTAIWLASDESSWMTGTAVPVDGGRLAGPID